jgi:hypothetical protein
MTADYPLLPSNNPEITRPDYLPSFRKGIIELSGIVKEIRDELIINDTS